MRPATTYSRWLFVLCILACFTSTAVAQRTVTLTLNTATIPDTTKTTDFIEVRGAVDRNDGMGFQAPFTFTNGGAVIDWSDMSTIEPMNVGGDYWEVSFQADNDAIVQFKFYSQQTQDAGLDGWEIDPNPRLPAAENDSTLDVHFFEFNGDYRGLEGDKGEYDWRPWETKEDSIAVWFRVYACTDDAQSKGYNPSDPSQSLSVRGDPLEGASMLTWGDDTGVHLTRESSVNGSTGFDLYSGAGYYPRSAAGTEQPFKFYINGTPDGWESQSDNRTFTIPESDSTLHWDYFGKSAPAACGTQPVTADVIFTVDLSAFEEIGIFDRARGDTLWAYGGFNGWQDCPINNPDLCLMQREPGTDIFAGVFNLTMLPAVSSQYKYFLDFNDENFVGDFGVDPPSGWEEGHLTGTNREFTFAGTPDQDLGIEFFNDVTSDNLIPEGTSIDVSFSVDMTPALADDAQPFDPAAGDSVTLRLADPVFAFTQGLYVADERDGNDFHLLIDQLVLTDDGDNVYTGTWTINGPTYSNLTFRYVYGQESTSFTEETGTGPETPGRNRTYYIKPNADGTWPTAYVLDTAVFHNETGPLPYETNPALVTGIEVVDNEVPENVWLGANYPNPFNPTTTFSYSIDRAQNVTIRVYDVLGRAVATLVDGVQPAATYQVSFDASRLASGVYFYRLETQNKVLSKRMLLIK